MLDDNDIKKLIEAQKEVFVTKEDLEGLIDIVSTKQELNEVGKRLDAIDEKINTVSATEKRVEYIENILNLPAQKN